MSTFDENGDMLPVRKYMATGGKSIHYLQTDPWIDCDCEDFVQRHTTVCKHVVAALVHENDPRVLGFMRSDIWDSR